jgi:acyl-CoA hydrolase
MSQGAAEIMGRHLRAGALVAVGDGAGSPIGLRDALADAAREVGGVRALLGWSFELPIDPTDRAAFTECRAHMGGYASRRALRSGDATYLPVRLGSLPAALRSHLRPDVLVAGLRPGRDGLVFGTEVAWMRAAIDAGATVLAEVNTALPDASDGVPVPDAQVVVVAETHRPPLELPRPEPTDVDLAIGRNVAALIPEGASIQFGPGAVSDSVLRSLEVSVRVDSGLLTDAVVELDERGLLVGTPRGAYLAGTSRLYEWSDGKPLVAPVELTHDLGRLSAVECFVAVNTALEIDDVGQVNVERVGDQSVGGIGGHADFSLAATRSPTGFSVIALPSRHREAPTLVERLSAPVTTPRSDVDVIVNEHGVADLRGLDDRERAAVLRALWRIP